MKITIYSYDSIHNPRCGGGGAYRLVMTHRLLARRHSIIVYTGTYPGSRPYDDAGVRFVPLGFGKSYLMSRITFSLIANIHSLFAKTDICVNDFSAYAPVFTFLFRPQKTVVQFHHFMGDIPLKKYGIFGILSMMAERVALRHARYMTTHGDGVADIITRRYPAKPMVRPTYIGFDRELLSENMADDRYVLYLGRIDVHMKGLDVLIAAFEKIAGRFPDHRLVVAGRGADDQISWMKNRIAASPVRERIDLRLSVPAQEKAALLHAATFVCMPSRFEGWCIVAIEAAASSKAGLGSDIPGLRDTIQNGNTGLLVPPRDADALARGMTTLLEDRDLRVRLGRAGFAWARNFTWEKVARNHEECYRSVLEQSTK